MTRIKQMALVLTLVLVGAALSGCAGGAATGDALIVAQGVDATTLDPGMHSETSTGNIERQIFDTVLELDEEMQLKPSLATSWEAVSPTVWEVDLVEGVLFHDGQELGAEDVAYSILRILDPEKRSPQAANLSAVKSVEVVGTHALRIITKEPYPVLPSRLANLRVVPKHYVEAVGDAKFSQEPVGSGPYKFVEWIKDDHITLEANEAYWRGEPEIKQVIFKPIPEAASRVMALQAGQVDIAVNVPPHQVDEVTKSKRAEIASVPSSRMIFAQFMMDQESPVSDPRVRLAINLAVNVESIIQNLLGGNGQAMTQTLSEMDFGFHGGLTPYGYDQERAKQLLAEAGYADGFTLRITATNGRYMMDKEVAEAVKSQLEEIGLTVELKFPEWGVYVDQIMGRTLDTDMWMIGWGNSLFDADGTLYSWFRSGERFFYYATDAARNRQVDQLLDLARISLDETVRERSYNQVLSYLHQDVPWLLLYQQMDLYGVSERINWQPRPDEAIILYQANWR